MDQELLNILACPKCQASLHIDDNHKGLMCSSCHVVYPIIEDIPVLLQEEAVPCAQWVHKKTLPAV